LSDSYENIKLERSGGVATITLDRPDSLNAWTPDLGTELLDAVRALAEDDEVRAVAITGAGRAFSSGADLKASRRQTDDGNPDMSSGLKEIYNPIIEAVTATPKPYVASVNGAAAGIGCSLALACDLIVAAESSFFLLAFVRVGLVPDGGSLFHVAARVGLTRAIEMAMRGQRVPAPTALEWGLINELVPDDQLKSRTDELLAELAAGPTVSYGNIKRLARSGALAGLVEQMDLEAELQQVQGETSDYQEGVTAFKEKRDPKFTGS
jgi:2-(1,2-epoxy-1,2-dihydrophenyl)acetyl-CoA isomerase